MFFFSPTEIPVTIRGPTSSGPDTTFALFSETSVDTATPSAGNEKLNFSADDLLNVFTSTSSNLLPSSPKNLVTTPKSSSPEGSNVFANTSAKMESDVTTDASKSLTDPVPKVKLEDRFIEEGSLNFTSQTTPTPKQVPFNSIATSSEKCKFPSELSTVFERKKIKVVAPVCVTKSRLSYYKLHFKSIYSRIVNKISMSV